MAILNGAMSVRRFRLVGAQPDNWREQYRERLEEFAFKEGPVEVGKEEREGWVQVHNLLETSFEDYNKWLYNDLILVALRVDKKTLPAKLLKATLEKKFAEWCEANGRKRAPKEVRDEIRDNLEAEWLRRALPRVQTIELCLNLRDQYAIIHSMSEGAADRIRKRVYSTFGLRLVATNPMAAIGDEDLTQRLMDTVPTRFGDLVVGGA